MGRDTPGLHAWIHQGREHHLLRSLQNFRAASGGSWKVHASNPPLLQVGSPDQQQQQQQLGLKPHGPPTEPQTSADKIHSDPCVHCGWRRAALILCFPDLSDVKDHREGLSKIQILTLKLTQIINQLLLLFFSRSVLSESLQPHELQHARLPCPSLSPRVCSNSCPLSWMVAIQPSYPMLPLLLLPSIFPSIRVFPNDLIKIIKKINTGYPSQSYQAKTSRGGTGRPIFVSQQLR